jgi:hypothetical protein
MSDSLSSGMMMCAPAGLAPPPPRALIGHQRAWLAGLAEDRQIADGVSCEEEPGPTRRGQVARGRLSAVSLG